MSDAVSFASNKAVVSPAPQVDSKPPSFSKEESAESCTCVKTEYHGKFASQEMACAVKIRYLGEDKVHDLLSGLLTGYNRYKFQADPDWDTDALKRCGQLASDASNTFLSLLRNVDEFANLEPMRVFLKKKFDSGSSPINFMAKSCEKNLTKKKKDGAGYCDYFEADNLTKLRNFVDPLITSRPNSNVPTLWPLIKQVVFGIAGSKILEHITIVDLPGISDTNYTRRTQTSEYLRICDALWIFSKIDRAADDTTVKGCSQNTANPSMETS
ncbi:Hypothetical protein R9X50_00695800 [Acrodontium crateriforme]|uniref:Uncharacterized protein n=1 Tax=Acrodontium crateriforme TaxID=150365 RepID=A0AAQ3MBS7_9PEZI|nr:Hypothetical protein R9X50_00695800 [Acrodontium crateriforme]